MENKEKTKDSIGHLNSMLRTIRYVTQLLVKEKDCERLIKSACHILVSIRGYYNAWIVLIDQSGKVVKTAEAGLGKDFLLISEQLKSNKLTKCGEKALKQSDIVIVKNPASECPDCPLSAMYTGRECLVIKLECNKKYKNHRKLHCF